LGTGLVTKESHLIYDIEMWLKKFKKQSKERSLIIKCHPSVAAKMRQGIVKSFIFQLKYFMRLKFAEDDKIRPGRFKFFSAKTGDELTKLVD
jgi:hypothetical protein